MRKVDENGSLEHDFDSTFRYVLVAARRARQLQNGSEPLTAARSKKACKIAQEEIQAGKVPYVKRDVPILKPEVEGAEIPRFAL